MEFPNNQRLAGRPSHSPPRSSLSARDMGQLRMSTAVGVAKNEFMPPTPNSQRPSMAQFNSEPVMLTDFMAAERTGPWNQFVAFSDNGSQGGSAPVTGPMYFNYRNSATLSAASDSGYASLSKPFIDDISSLGDGSFDPDIQTISTQFRTVNFNHPNPREAELPAANSRTTITTATSARANLKCPVCGAVVKTNSVLKKHHQRHTKPYICVEPGCSRDVGFSTQNDLVRHHRSVHKTSTSTSGKEYICTLDRCKDKFKLWPRADNFRSHLRSVHGIPQERTTIRAYLDTFLCQRMQTEVPHQGAPPTYTSKPPRENGSDLLQGVGGGSIESELNPRDFPNTLTTWAMQAFPPQSPDSSAAHGNDQAMADFEDLRLDPVDGTMDSPVSQQPLRHSDIPRQVQETLSHLPYSRPVSALGRADGRETKPFQVPSQRSRQAIGPTEPASIEPRLTYRSQAQQETNTFSLTARSKEISNPESIINTVSSSVQPSRQIPDKSAEVKTSSPNSRELETSAMSPVNAEGQAAAAIPQEDDAPEKDKIMKILDGIPTDVLSLYLREKGICSNTDSGLERNDSRTKQKHHCTICKRKFSRKSELNKHTRRHDRPYACTFPKCTSDFGSKSDWRRHENTQHFQLVVWKCDERIGESDCPKACHMRDVFERHLREEHGIREVEELEARQERCRVDRSSNNKFWCGFCKDVKVVHAQENNGAWGERYDHIGNHFTGANGFSKANKKEWVCGDTDSSNGETDEMEGAEADVGIVKRKREEVEEGGRGVKKLKRQRM